MTIEIPFRLKARGVTEENFADAGDLIIYYDDFSIPLDLVPRISAAYIAEQVAYGDDTTPGDVYAGLAFVGFPHEGIRLVDWCKYDPNQFPEDRREKMMERIKFLEERFREAHG